MHYVLFSLQTFFAYIYIPPVLRLLLIWSPTHSVPGHLVPHNWSPRTNSPGSFGPHGQMVPKTIGPQNLLVVSKSIMEPFFQFFDIGWSTLDIMDDFKPISKKNLFTFRQIITFCFCSKTLISLLFWIRNGIFKQKIIW